MSDEVKGLLRSRTFWGALVALIAPFLGMAGYAVTEEDTAAVVDTIMGTVAAAGALLAIFGRIKASKKVVIGGAKKEGSESV